MSLSWKLYLQQLRVEHPKTQFLHTLTVVTKFIRIIIVLMKRSRPYNSGRIANSFNKSLNWSSHLVKGYCFIIFVKNCKKCSLTNWIREYWVFTPFIGFFSSMMTGSVIVRDRELDQMYQAVHRRTRGSASGTCDKRERLLPAFWEFFSDETSADILVLI